MEKRLLDQKTAGMSRYYGLDLLRIVAALYVAILHILGLGGVCDAAQPGTVQYAISWFMQMWVYCAVNIFALISGYVGFTQEQKRYNFGNILVLWLQVVVLSVAVKLVAVLICPDSLSLPGLIRMCMPVTANTYWYFTSYCALFFVIPLLNSAVRNSSRLQLRRVFAVLICLFSLYSTLGDRWRLANGFSFLWLTVLYLLGAIMKKCSFGSGLSSKAVCLGIAVCNVLSVLCKLWENKHGFLLGHSLVEQTYLAPTHLLGAMLHIVLFSRLKLTQRQKKWLSVAAPGAFAVYILNCHPVIMENMITDRFAHLAEASLPVLILWILGFSAMFVMVSLAIDWLRRKLFELLKVKLLADKLMNKAATAVDYVTCRWFAGLNEN